MFLSSGASGRFGFGCAKKSSSSQASAKGQPDKGLSQLAAFREKLAELQRSGKGNIRVAYYGDSIIEGDLITAKLRELLQQSYGGSGVGLMPVTSIVKEFRPTIVHNCSPNWESHTFLNRAGGIALGMAGQTEIPRPYAEAVLELTPDDRRLPDDTPLPVSLQKGLQVDGLQKVRRQISIAGPAWVEYSGTEAVGGASAFTQVRLFFSHAAPGTRLRVIYDGSLIKSFSVPSGADVGVLDISPAKAVRKVRLEFDPLRPLRVYGVSFDEPQGLHVDNLATRSFSGIGFQAISKDVFRGSQQALGYDLVVLQFGTNVARASTPDYGFYKAGMIESIRHIQAALPGVPILVIGVHDRGVKLDGEFQTLPGLANLVKAQAAAAAQTNSAFWNLYEAMGGENSMKQYVRSSPALAAVDHIHFTRAGSERVARMLFDVLVKP